MEQKIWEGSKVAAPSCSPRNIPGVAAMTPELLLHGGKPQVRERWISCPRIPLTQVWGSLSQPPQEACPFLMPPVPPSFSCPVKP